MCQNIDERDISIVENHVLFGDTYNFVLNNKLRIKLKILSKPVWAENPLGACACEGDHLPTELVEVCVRW